MTLTGRDVGDPERECVRDDRVVELQSECAALRVRTRGRHVGVIQGELGTPGLEAGITGLLHVRWAWGCNDITCNLYSCIHPFTACKVLIYTYIHTVVYRMFQLCIRSGQWLNSVLLHLFNQRDAIGFSYLSIYHHN